MFYHLPITILVLSTIFTLSNSCARPCSKEGCDANPEFYCAADQLRTKPLPSIPFPHATAAAPTPTQKQKQTKQTKNRQSWTDCDATCQMTRCAYCYDDRRSCYETCVRLSRWCTLGLSTEEEFNEMFSFLGRHHFCREKCKGHTTFECLYSTMSKEDFGTCFPCADELIVNEGKFRGRLFKPLLILPPPKD